MVVVCSCVKVVLFLYTLLSAQMLQFAPTVSDPYFDKYCTFFLIIQYLVMQLTSQTFESVLLCIVCKYYVRWKKWLEL